MIKKFLKDLPYRLVHPMNQEYEKKVKEFSNWLQNTKSQKIKKYSKHKEVFYLIFALGIYYRYIIAPLVSTKDFFNRLNNSNTSIELKLANQKIDKQIIESINNAHKYFLYIINEFNIPETLFAESDLKKIVNGIINIEEQNNG